MSTVAASLMARSSASPGRSFPSETDSAGEGGQTLGPKLLSRKRTLSGPLGGSLQVQRSVMTMTTDRDFKRLIRARAAKKGEAYQAARRRLVADEQQQQRALRPEYERAVHEYFDEWARQLDQFQASGLRTPSLERSASPAGIRGGPLPALVGPGPHASWKAWEAALVVPVEAMQDAALFHANPRVRRECLSVLDHFASDASVDVFRRALRDPVPRVRLIALHGLSCEQCRVGQNLRQGRRRRPATHSLRGSERKGAPRRRDGPGSVP